MYQCGWISINEQYLQPQCPGRQRRQKVNTNGGSQNTERVECRRCRRWAAGRRRHGNRYPMSPRAMQNCTGGKSRMRLIYVISSILAQHKRAAYSHQSVSQWESHSLLQPLFAPFKWIIRTICLNVSVYVCTRNQTWYENHIIDSVKMQIALGRQ